MTKPRATSTVRDYKVNFLIDSGATHDVINETFARATDLLGVASRSERTISGFDGSTSRSSYEISLYLGEDPTPTEFIITKLKDAYDGILGMPWLKNNGHRIDWNLRCFRMPPEDVAAATAVSSIPKNTSTDGAEPRRKARISDEGVCVDDTLALPQ
ncbi:hypothetical protein PSTG_17649, partial [Puccinia striiformis f. sp. tritici PST-78]